MQIGNVFSSSLLPHFPRHGSPRDYLLLKKVPADIGLLPVK